MPGLSPDASPLLARVATLRQTVAQRAPASLAAATHTQFQAQAGGGVFEFAYFGAAAEFSFPACEARLAHSPALLPPLDQAMVAYYFHNACGGPIAGQWVAFSELPEGRFYTQAFQSYTGAVLARRFGDDLARFVQAAEQAGGRRFDLGDAAFAFLALPLAPLAVVAWQGDEEFPPSYRLLFDASAPRHLSTDTCAILGSMLTRRLVSW